jgi:hypothetical protein
VIPQFKTANFEKKRGLCFRPTKCMELLSMVDIAMDRKHIAKTEQLLAESVAREWQNFF